jgi:hypothetical protein
MTGENQIPGPISFNPFKHHRNYIMELLDNLTQPELKTLLLSVNDNYIDIYTGHLSTEAICLAVLAFLEENMVPDEIAFKNWIAASGGYRLVKLKDQSEWIIRKGNEKEKFIHLHPAKTGSHSIRFKGSTLKTIYQLKIGFPEKFYTPSLELINRARIEIGLSPIKKLEPGKGILKCYELLFWSKRKGNL